MLPAAEAFTLISKVMHPFVVDHLRIHSMIVESARMGLGKSLFDVAIRCPAVRQLALRPVKLFSRHSTDDEGSTWRPYRRSALIHLCALASLR